MSKVARQSLALVVMAVFAIGITGFRDPSITKLDLNE